MTQKELQSVIDLQNLVEVRAAGVRRRLEAGARLEHGKLGASAWDREPLESISIGTATEADGFGILDIGPADDHIKFRDEVSQPIAANLSLLV